MATGDRRAILGPICSYHGTRHPLPRVRYCASRETANFCIVNHDDSADDFINEQDVKQMTYPPHPSCLSLNTHVFIFIIITIRSLSKPMQLVTCIGSSNLFFEKKNPVIVEKYFLSK